MLGSVPRQHGMSKALLLFFLLTTTLMADIGINDRLVILRSLIDEACFEFIDVIGIGAQST